MERIISEMINNNSIDINNVFQIIVLCFSVIIIIAEYVQSFFSSNIELLLMKQKEIQKRNIARAVFLFMIFSLYNVILAINEMFIFIGIGIFGVCVIVMGVTKLFSFIAKKDVQRFMENLELVGIIVAVPAIVGGISIGKDINIFSMAIIGALIETSFLLLMINGINVNIKNVIIQNKNEKFYVYRKIDDNALLCGDAKVMNDAKQIVAIDIKEILNRNYYLYLEKKNELEVELKSEDLKSTSDK